MNYLKIEKSRFNLTDDGVQADEEKLTLKIKNEKYSFDEVRDIFSALDDVTVYGAIEQEDGSETDEYVASHYEHFTKLQSIGYDLKKDTWNIVLVEPNDLEERIIELEKSLNRNTKGGDINSRLSALEEEVNKLITPTK